MDIKKLVQNPLFVKEILNLPYDSNVSIDNISPINSITSHVFILNLVIIKSHKRYRESMFVKYSSSDDFNIHYKLCHNEIAFYNNIMKSGKNINVIPHCLYANENDGNTLLLLSNLSPNYESITERIITCELVLHCSSSLAKFHSFFWNDATMIKSFGATDLERQIDIKRSDIDKFITHTSKHLSQSIIGTIFKAFDISNSLLQEINTRKKELNNITIINGDAHIFNFMVSSDKKNNPIIVDFQFGEAGLGCLDLAHLTRKVPRKLLSHDLCLKIIKNYYNSLSKHSKRNYTFTECYNLSFTVLKQKAIKYILKIPENSIFLGFFTDSY